MPCNGCNHEVLSPHVYKFGRTEIVIPRGSELIAASRSIVRTVTQRHVSLDEKRQRLLKCVDCPEATNLVELNGEQQITSVSQCKKCACFVSQKAKSPEEACPLGNW
jgi:hypothetical protein